MFKMSKVKRIIEEIRDQKEYEVSATIPLVLIGKKVSIQVTNREIATTLESYIMKDELKLHELAKVFAERIQKSTNFIIDAQEPAGLFFQRSILIDKLIEDKDSFIETFSSLVYPELIRVRPITREIAESSISINGLTLKVNLDDNYSTRFSLDTKENKGLNNTVTLRNRVETPQQLLEASIETEYMNLIKTLTYESLRIVDARYSGGGLVKVTIGTKLNQAGVSNSIIHNVRVIYLVKEDLINMMLEGKYEPLAVAYRK